MEGIKNALITKQDVEAIAKERQEICDACSIKSLNFVKKEICDSNKQVVNVETGKLVNGCGCLLHLKQRSLHSECPAKKWLALTDDEEIGNALNELE